MERLVLFSQPGGAKFEEILSTIFPVELKHKVLAYMPSDGSNSPQKYTDLWKEIAERHGTEFRFINNAKKNAKDEAEKLLGSNILLITGGNTFGLLSRLRESGLDRAIKEFAKKNNVVISGFSAGAIVLTPTIEVCNLPNYDENLVGLTDLTGLGLVNFEVFPHYDPLKDKNTIESYRHKSPFEVKEITNDDYIVTDLKH